MLFISTPAPLFSHFRKLDMLSILHFHLVRVYSTRSNLHTKGAVLWCHFGTATKINIVLAAGGDTLVNVSLGSTREGKGGGRGRKKETETERRKSERRVRVREESESESERGERERV